MEIPIFMEFLQLEIYFENFGILKFLELGIYFENYIIFSIPEIIFSI